MQKDLQQLIHQIYTTILENGLKRYDSGEREAKRDRELFQKVKEETKPLFALIDLWEEVTMANIVDLPIMPNQVKNTKENLEIFVLHSYYRDVRRKRFMEIYHSINYVMNLLKEAHNNERNERNESE
jgi:hypothetical protein